MKLQHWKYSLAFLLSGFAILCMTNVLAHGNQSPNFIIENHTNGLVHFEFVAINGNDQIKSFPSGNIKSNKFASAAPDLYFPHAGGGNIVVPNFSILFTYPDLSTVQMDFYGEVRGAQADIIHVDNLRPSNNDPCSLYRTYGASKTLSGYTTKGNLSKNGYKIIILNVNHPSSKAAHCNN